MSIVEVTEDFRSYGATDSIADGIAGTRAFLVRSDDPLEYIGNVISAVPVTLGDLLPGTLISLCYERRGALRDHDDRLNWIVTCSYKSILNQIEQQRISFPNPLDRTPRIDWTARTIMGGVVTALIARNGPSKAYSVFDPGIFTFGTNVELVSNAATDAFDPPLTNPVTEWIANVTVNLTAPPAWVMTYNESVNSANVTIDGLVLLKGCGKIENLKISPLQYENGTPFRQLSYSVVCRKPRKKRTGESAVPEPWDDELLNEGMREWGASGKWRNITDSSGQAVSKPVPLLATGLAIDPSGAPIPESSLTYILVRRLERQDFTILPGMSP